MGARGPLREVYLNALRHQLYSVEQFGWLVDGISSTLNRK